MLRERARFLGSPIFAANPYISKRISSHDSYGRREPINKRPSLPDNRHTCMGTHDSTISQRYLNDIHLNDHLELDEDLRQLADQVSKDDSGVVRANASRSINPGPSRWWLAGLHVTKIMS